MNIQRLICWLILIVPLPLFSQSDCNSATQLCNDIYSETDASLTAGVPEYVGSCNVNEVSSMWYTFTIQSPGDLAFILNPNNNNDDYDWVLFNISNVGCAGIGSSAPEVSCNSYGSFGSNGSTGISNQNGGNGNSNGPGDLNGPAFNANLNVSVGQTFALCVMNWSQSFDGYQINFSESSAGLYDNANPEIVNVNSVCNQNYFIVTMSEVVLANSVQLGDFVLTGPAGPLPITSVAMNNSTGSNDDEIILNLPVSNIAEGNYTLEITNSNGGVADACANAAIETYSFYYNPIDLSVNAGSDVTICNNGTVTLTATGEFTTLQWTGGPTTSDYTVATPGTYTVQASSNGCNVSDEVVVSLATTTWNLGMDVAFCENAPVPIVSTEQVLWEDGTMSTTSNPTTTGYWSAQYFYGDGCVASDSIHIEVHTQPYYNLGNDTTLCNGEIITLQTPIEVMWNGGAIGMTYNVQSAATISATFNDGFCFFQDEITVDYLSPPFIDWEGDVKVICTGDSVVFDAHTYAADAYLWFDLETDSVATIKDSGQYWITLTNTCGTYTANWWVLTQDCNNYAYIPNSFTPDNDGINDAWKGQFNRILEFDLKVFNRDGEVIFKTTDPNQYWNGSFLQGEYYVPDGIYPYQCNIKFLNLEIRKMQGTVAILR